MNAKKILSKLQSGSLTIQEAKRQIKQLEMTNDNMPPVEPSGNKQQAKRVHAAADTQLGDIAVIGLSGRFPKADNVEQFWDNIQSGRDCVDEVPTSRWDVNNYYDPTPGKPGKTSIKCMGALDNIDKFDPLFFNISPADAECMDPQQRLFLEACWHCFEDAGINPDAISGSDCGVFVGCAGSDYTENAGVDPNNIKNYFSASPAILSARISYFLNLRGPCVSIDTACSSSLVAIAEACDSITLNRSDMALAGGVCLLLGTTSHLSLSQAGMLSDRCYSFDDRASGFVPGEAVGVVLLKRLEKAQQDGDRIQSVIRGWGVNQDGKTNGISAPSASSQTQLIKKVYNDFGIDPSTISLVEAHGTGTKLGDPIEAQALTNAFQAFTQEQNYCALGSVKSNMGHALLAAGIAGVFKTIMALKHRQLPPTIHYEKTNSHIRFEETPFYVNDQLQEWQVEGGQLRRAAVSSFGLSGTNAHIVIDEYLPEQEPTTVTKQEVEEKAFVLSARTKVQLLDYVTAIKSSVEENLDIDLRSFAYTMQVGRKPMACRVAFVYKNVEELLQKLDGLSLNGLDPASIEKDTFYQEVDEEIALAFFSDDAALHSNVDQWLRHGDVLPVLKLWVQGLEVDWSTLYGEDKPLKIEVPVYPFARKSYWLVDQSPKVNVEPLEEEQEKIPSNLKKTAVNEGANSARDSLSGESRAQGQVGEQKAVIETVENRLIHHAARITKVDREEFRTDASLEKYGYDSINIIELCDVINADFEIELTPPQLYEYPTIAALAGYIVEQNPSDVLNELSGMVTTAAELVEVDVSNAVAGDQGALSNDLEDQTSDSIAIVGISCRFPQADDIHEFWSNIEAGTDCITEVPSHRWDWKAYYNEVESSQEPMKWGGFLERIEAFDASHFDIPEVEAKAMDPIQRLMTTYVWKALDDAAIKPSDLSQSETGVFIAAAPVAQYSNQQTGDSGHYAATSLATSCLPNRISYLLNLAGPSEYYEAGCASSLVAIDHAINAIQRQECQQAIVGGINLMLSHQDIANFDSLGHLSHDGKSRSFQADASGYVQSEGVVAMVFKPVSVAVRDSDNIWGVIKGAGVAHGGRGMSFSAPNPKGIKTAMERAITASNIDPRTIGYIEANGIAAPIGDAIEINAISGCYENYAYSEKDRVVPQECYISSLKPTQGHGVIVSGMAALLKSIMAIRHHVKPGIPNFTEPSQYITADRNRFRLAAQNAEWNQTTDVDGNLLPRRASISSFGLGGVNAHLIVEEYCQQSEVQKPLSGHDKPNAIVLSATEDKQLSVMSKHLLSHLEKHNELTLTDVAATLQLGRESYKRRLAIVADSMEELKRRLGPLAEAKTVAAFEDAIVQSEGVVFATFGEQVNQSLSNENQPLEVLLAKGDMSSIARSWVNGQSIAWEQLYQANQYCRVSLPGFPFSISAWTDENQRGQEKPASMTDAEVERVEIVDDAPVRRTAVNNRQSITDRIVNQLARELSVSADKIDVDENMRDIGFTSIMFMNMLQLLQTIDHTVDLEHLTDCTTVQDVIDIACRNVTALEDEATSAESSSPSVSAEETQSLKELSRNDNASQGDVTNVNEFSHRWPHFTNLVKLNAVDSGVPVFWIHGPEGGVQEYAQIASTVGRPFYGLEARGYRCSLSPLLGIQEMALLYIHIIRTVQPEGPYDLGGYCSGGLIAYEVSRQLQELGADVRTVTAIDTLDGPVVCSDHSQVMMVANQLIQYENRLPTHQGTRLDFLTKQQLDLSLTEDEYFSHVVEQLLLAGVKGDSAQVAKKLKHRMSIYNNSRCTDYSALPLIDPNAIHLYEFVSEGSYYGKQSAFYCAEEDTGQTANLSRIQWANNIPHAESFGLDKVSHLEIFQNENTIERIKTCCQKIYDK